MKKHEYNFFPECNEQDFNAIVESMKTIGYDSKFPIYTYEEKILDGWNRYQAAKKAKVEPIIKEFRGTRQEALEFSIRANKDRRHLTSSQLATLAILAEPLFKAIEEETEKERRKKQAETQTISQKTDTLLPKNLGNSVDRKSNESAEKVAKIFNTNNSYVSQAKKLKESSPEKFEQVLKGEKNFSEIKKEEKQIKLEQKKEERQELIKKAEESLRTESDEKFSIELGNFYKIGKHIIYCGDNTDLRFKKFLQDYNFAFAFADPPYNENVSEWDNDFTWKQDYILDNSKIVFVTPGISQIQKFMQITKMRYRWSISTWINNGMTRGELGFGNWIYTGVFSNEKSIHKGIQDFNQVSIALNDDRKEHKGRKPIPYMQYLVENFSKEKEYVLDVFLGSGTTLFSCIANNRICIGAEKDIDSCKDFIIKAAMSCNARVEKI